jgi:hypothetical protein
MRVHQATDGQCVTLREAIPGSVLFDGLSTCSTMGGTVRFLDQILNAILLFGAIGLSVLGFLLGRWGGLGMAIGATVFCVALYLFVDWAWNSLRRFAVRRAVLRILAAANSKSTAERALEPSAWVITRDGKALIADRAHRRFYLLGQDGHWKAFSSRDVKRVWLSRRHKLLGGVETTVLFSGIQSERVFELQIADGNADLFVSSLQTTAS